jgi:hypothetical protein
MNTRKFALSALLPILLGLASATQARPAADSCVLSQYGASSVAPYRAEENAGYGTYTQLRGAQVFVPAREGLTQQWLALQVERGLHASTCRPSVSDVRVQVVSAGNGFWVQLIAANASSASDLLSWAQGVVGNAKL